MKARIILLLVLFTALPVLSQDIVKDTISSYVDPQVQAEFPGGNKAFNEYVSSSLKPTAKGKLVVRFTINTYGKLFNIEIAKSINKETDEHLIQILEKCPVWTPAYLNGKPVTQSYIFPFLVSSVKN